MADDARAGHAGEARRRSRRTVGLAIGFGVLCFLAILAVLPNVGPNIRLYRVASTSMAPGLPIGDMLVVSRWSYGYSRTSFDAFELPIEGRWPDWRPRRGDVVVYRAPEDGQTVYEKRVVGLPGETIQLVGGRLWIDGVEVPRESVGGLPDPFDPGKTVSAFRELLPGAEPYVVIEAEGDQSMLDETEPVTLGPRQLFMLGDNRDNSVDSRLPRHGPIPLDALIGRVVMRLGS